MRRKLIRIVLTKGGFQLSYKIDQSYLLLGRKFPVNGITDSFSYGLEQAPIKEWGALLEETIVIMAVGGNILDLSHPISLQLKELSQFKDHHKCSSIKKTGTAQIAVNDTVPL